MNLTENQKVRYGVNVLKQLQNEYVSRFGDDWIIGYDELKTHYTEIQIKQIGEAVALSDFGIRRLEESMERVVYNNGNKIPSTFSITNGIAEELSSFDFSLMSDVAIEIGRDSYQASKDVIENTGEILSNTTGSLKALTKYSKYIIPALLAIVAIGYSFGVSGGSLYSKGDK